MMPSMYMGLTYVDSIVDASTMVATFATINHSDIRGTRSGDTPSHRPPYLALTGELSAKVEH